MQTAHNTPNNGAPFMVEINYSGRSMARIQETLIVDSSACQCVVWRNVMRHARRLENGLSKIKRCAF